MPAILGISAFYHDAAAALVVDGEIVAAAQEERFTRRKHDPGFPNRAVESCLKQAGLAVDDLDYVGFYDKPMLKFERLLETYLAHGPRGWRSFLKAMPTWLNQKMHLPRVIRRELGLRGTTTPLVFAEHHESHAASAFYPSPFERAAVLTIDGVGEWATASIALGEGSRTRLLEEMHFPHSLGLLYSAFTYFCGFRVNSGEYKLMGLAPYGEPNYVDDILEHLIDLKADGSLRLNQKYFDYAAGLRMTNRAFAKLFGGPARQPESPITQRELDLAASVQVVTERAVMAMAEHAHTITGCDKLCLAGGVALNCVANGKLLAEGPFDDIWIQPAAGDAGGALGTALLIHHQILEHDRGISADRHDRQGGSRLGPSFSDDESAEHLEAVDAVFTTLPDDEALTQRIAELLEQQQVVGWFQGRMEFGPRALGGRSILGDPRSEAMQSVMNRKIKFRESFRPFAPIVLAEHAAEWFELPRGKLSPYMLLVAPVAEGHRLPPPDLTVLPEGLDRLGVPTSTIPAVTHVDGSSRLQTVDDHTNPMLHGLLSAFHERTGVPVLINTSFNVRGEPIVATPEDAYRCFMATDMDVLCIGRHVLLKTEQPACTRPDRQAHLEKFALD